MLNWFVNPARFLPFGVWLHDLDPVIFWRLRWYGLSYVAAFLVGWFVVRLLARADWTRLSSDRAGDLILALAVGVVVGARLGYVILYQPSLLWTWQDALPFWGLLAVNHGGMASHGGMVGLIVAAGWFARRHRIDLFNLLDVAAFIGPLGLMLGRIANFINGELIGRTASANLPWAVKFPQEIYDWPTERILRLQENLPAPQQLGLARSHWTLGEIVGAVQRGEQRVIEVLEPMLAPRHPSQLYASVLEGLLVFIVLLLAWRRPRKPGVIGALFCVSYACGRIIVEFFRRPDPHIADAEFAWLSITRGQWLSGLLLLLGIWGLWYARRRPAAAIGGWGCN